MRSLLATLAAIVAAGPAAACINDIELVDHEREFRSQYRDAAPAPTPSAEPESPTNSTPFAFGGGALLLVGAVVVSFRKPTEQG